MQKKFQIRTSIKQLLTKMSNFQDIAPNFTYSQKSYFFKYICNFLDQLLHPYKFYGRDMSGILFFIFASREALMEVKGQQRLNTINMLDDKQTW